MERKLLQEAIADAKTVKQVAIAQAEQTVLENIRPHLAKIFSAKVNEMEEEFSIDEQDDNGNVESNDAEQFEDEALDLDEILNEIEEVEEVKKDEEPEEETEPEETPEEDESTEDNEELNIEDMSDDDLKAYIEDVIEDMIQSGQLVPGEEYEGEEETEPEETPEEDDEEVDIDIEDEESENEEKEDEIDDLLEETNPLENELEEAYQEIEQLQESLKQQKLQNSKLLFTNKILIAKSLNESKKLQVLKAFDNASTIKEVKVIYETLKDNLNSKPLIKEHKSLASKPMSVIKENQNTVIAVDSQIERWKKLAGII